jgi:hypothetical protein
LRLASWNITMFVAYEQIKGYMFPVVKKEWLICKVNALD